MADTLAQLQAEHAAFGRRGLKLDMTRGKPAADQLDLASAMLSFPGNGDHTAADGTDARNYGGTQGLPEVRALFSPMLAAPAAQMAIGENSSLAIMHDCIVWALLKGVPGSTAPWGQGPVSFICPVPGYDRHFAICEEFGIRMLPVPLTGEGPDMDAVEELAADPSVKGIWCVPKYSNPTGEIYSDAVTKRLASMKTRAADFRIFWDNAYTAHHLTATRHEVADILALCAEAGNPDRAFVFASTSKITLAGGGLAFFAGSPANVKWYLDRVGKRTVGPDKLNQLRHLRFLRTPEGIVAHMDKQRALIAPKFDAVLAALDDRLSDVPGVRWLKPEGGYFITLNAVPGTAKRVVALAKEVGIALTPAGATHPGGNDPDDSVLRLAPTFPSLADVKAAAEGIALCIALAAAEKRAG